MISHVLDECPDVKAPRMTEILREHGYEGSAAGAESAHFSFAKRERDEIRWNHRFLHLRGHYDFHATACTPETRAIRARSRERCAI